LRSRAWHPGTGCWSAKILTTVSRDRPDGSGSMSGTAKGVDGASSQVAGGRPVRGPPAV